MNGLETAELECFSPASPCVGRIGEERQLGALKNEAKSWKICSN